MVSSISPSKILSALGSRFKSKAAEVVTQMKQGLCDHWWVKETVWTYSADPEKRTVASRKATCVLCGHSEPVEDWSRFPVNMRPEAECLRLAEKIGALQLVPVK